MSYSVRYEDYTQIISELNALDLLLEELGLHQRRDRIRLHTANIQELEQAKQDGSINEIIKSSKRT